MRITRRTSGGRGEYEISEATPEGVVPTDLLGREIVLRFPNGLRISTGTRLTSQGGKRRLRRISGRGEMQIPKQVASVLLMPEPVREDIAFGVGDPVMQSRRYGIEHISVEKADVTARKATLHVGNLILKNASIAAEEIPVRTRLDQLARVWNAADQFPDDIADLIRQHRGVIQTGQSVSRGAQSLVRRIQSLVSERSTDMGIVYSHQTDVLDGLGGSLDLVIPEPVIEPDDVDPEEVEIKLRTVKEWKRWANARGPKSAKFRFDVRRAYRGTCVICGDHFPKTRINAPGVDAAHILPWSQYDLDEISNGVCLCKLHHWAFDESLITISHEAGRYVAQLPDHVEERLMATDPDFSVATLRRGVGKIDVSRLPRKRAEWPKPQFLDLLNASIPN